jgi:hypothetical protein
LHRLGQVGLEARDQRPPAIVGAGERGHRGRGSSTLSRILPLLMRLRSRRSPISCAWLFVLQRPQCRRPPRDGPIGVSGQSIERMSAPIFDMPDIETGPCPKTRVAGNSSRSRLRCFLRRFARAQSRGAGRPSFVRQLVHRAGK